jgi:hypothetical protein
MPSRGFLSIASACSGISGRDQASCAGDRSSVLVSPVTLNTVSLISAGTSGLRVNHSASAQDCNTALAWALPASAFSLTSWKASNISSVPLSWSAASSPSSASSSRSISGWML